MQLKLTYLKNFAKLLIWPVILGLGQFLLILIFTVFFNLKYINTLQEQFPNLTSTEINIKFQEVLSTNKYIQELNEYLNDYNIIIILILSLILFPIIKKKYKMETVSSKILLTNKNMVEIMIISIFLAFSLNVIIFVLNSIFEFTTRYESNTIYLSTVITTGLLVPILEEYVFRGIVYNKLKKFNNTKTALILSTIIFALFHFGLSQIIYAFIIGFYLIIIYEKTNNINISIMAHIIINITTILFIPFIVSVNILIQIILIVIWGLVIYKKFSIKNN